MIQSRITLLQLGQWFTILTPLLMLAGPAAMDISAGLVVVVFLLHSGIHRDFRWLSLRWVKLVGLLWVWMCLRNLFTDDVLANVGRSASFLRYPLFAVALAYWVLPDEKTQQRLWRAALLAVLFLIVDCGWQYIYHTDLVGRPAEVIENNVLRLTGPFSNPRVGITILWLFFPLLIPLLCQPKMSQRLWGIALLAAMTVAIYLSGERMALLLVGLGAILSFLLFASLRRWLVLAVLATLLPIAWLSIADSTLVSRQWHETRLQVVDFAGSTYGRTWQSATGIGTQYPLAGVGSKQFQTECRNPAYGPTDDNSLNQRCPMHTHNIYLEWLVEYGVLGLGLFLLMITTWLVDLARSGPVRQWHPLLMGLTIMLLLRLWPLSVTPSQFVAWSAIPFWLVLGWLYARLLAARSGEAI